MPKIHPKRLKFANTIKLYKVKEYMKSNFFVLQVSFEINLNMHMSSTLVLMCTGRNNLHMTNRPNLHPIILLPIADGNAAFRLASNLKTAWLAGV